MRISYWSSDVCSSDLRRESRRSDLRHSPTLPVRRKVSTFATGRSERIVLAQLVSGGKQQFGMDLAGLRTWRATLSANCLSTGAAIPARPLKDGSYGRND